MKNLSSPKTIYCLLKDIDHKPKKKLGQNFLVDFNILKKALFLANIKKGDIFIEIGPGLGTLTNELLKNEIHVYAIEYDFHLYNFLKNSIKSRSFFLIYGDALKNSLAGFLPKDNNYKIIANLPYAISTPWMENILSQNYLPNIIVIMLQKETLDRFKAIPGTKKMGSISIILNSAYDIITTFNVSNQCFYPKPKIDSVLLSLRIKKNPFLFHSRTKKIIRNFFIYRRKQINTLIKNHENINNVIKMKIWLKNNNISEKIRPENISLKDWQELDLIIRSS